MHKGLIFALILAAVFVAISGCTQPPICGDNICNGVETTLTCPDDCGSPVAFASFGDESVILNDFNGVKMEIPFFIQLQEGSNDFEVAGKIFEIDINTINDTAIYTSGSNLWSTIKLLNKNVNDSETVTLVTDATGANHDFLRIDYVLAGDKATNHFWLLLKSQKIKNFDWDGTTPFVELKGTSVPDLSNTLGYYLPDKSAFEVLTNLNLPHQPNEGDSYTFTSDWVIDYFGQKEFVVIDNRDGTRK